jgi:PKD repeat protein
MYYTVCVDGVWQKPVPLQEPFNSQGDDYGLILNTAMDTGYFVSDRSGSDDIFLSASELPVFSGCAPQEENDYCYLFYEPNNNELDTTTFAYEWDLGDGTKIRSLKADHCFSGPGNYFVQLNVVDKVTKETFLSQASDSFLVEDIVQPYILAADTVEAGSTVSFSAEKTYLPGTRIEGYYWDFNDGFQSEGEKTTHRFSYPGTYMVQLGVSGSGGNIGIPGQCVTRRIVVVNPIK